MVLSTLNALDQVVLRKAVHAGVRTIPIVQIKLNLRQLREQLS